MLKTFFTELRKVNIFGREMQFEKDYTNRFNSTESFILSIFVFIATVVFTFIIGEEIYKKEKPKFTTSTDKVEVNEAEFSTTEFPFLIGFATSDYLPLTDSELKKYVEVSVKFTQITPEGITYTNTKFVDCNLELIKMKSIKKL